MHYTSTAHHGHLTCVAAAQLWFSLSPGQSRLNPRCRTLNPRVSSTGHTTARRHPVQALPSTFQVHHLEHVSPFVLQEQTACCSTAHIQIFCPPGALLGSAAQHDALTAAATGVLSALRSQGMFSGWRDELYPVSSAFDVQPALLLERAAAPYFGIRAYGVHINGYVCKGDGRKLLWVARRSRSKPTWPGLLDHIVAGGQVRGQRAASYAL
jgi:hypothetical protein